jgi:two-component system, OmpR family, KDP operon response regulator KdpE
MTTHLPVIAVIEDDAPIRRFLRTALEANGYAVEEAADGVTGLAVVANRRAEALILDLGLPDLDGVEVIRRVRGWSALPIIVLSARTHEKDKVAALDAGADDYVVKPFGESELLARLRAALRRGARTREAATTLETGELAIDLEAHTVKRNGEAVRLTPTEWRLLAELSRNAGKVLTQRHLLLAVWGPAHVESPHYLRIYMSNLRQKLEADPARPRHLLTETGVGYRFGID